MALINCPECGHQMSDTAKKCPNCGYNLKPVDTKSWTLGVLLVIIGLSLIVFSFITMANWGWGSIDYTTGSFLVGCLIYVIGFVAMFLGCKMLNKVFSYSRQTFIGLACVCVVALIIFFLSFGFRSYTKAEGYCNKQREERVEQEQLLLEQSSPKARKGWEYFIENVKNKETRLLRIQEQLDDISSVIGIKNTSIVLYTVEDYGDTYNVWVFFKGNNPKDMALTKMGEYLNESQIRRATILLLQ